MKNTEAARTMATLQRGEGGYTYRRLNVHALVTKAWKRSYSRDREVGRKLSFWRLLAFKDGREVRRRFDKLSDVRLWLETFAAQDEHAADQACRASAP
jgi:hypothetical protein